MTGNKWNGRSEFLRGGCLATDRNQRLFALTLLLVLVLGGCQGRNADVARSAKSFEDASIVLSPWPGSSTKVENGLAYDKARGEPGPAASEEPRRGLPSAPQARQAQPQHDTLRLQSHGPLRERVRGSDLPSGPEEEKHARNGRVTRCPPFACVARSTPPRKPMTSAMNAAWSWRMPPPR
jgi:hypothetical protein